MDIGTLIGCILGGLLILCVIMFGGQDGFVPFVNITSLLIVFGGTAIVLLISFPFKSICKSVVSAKKCFAKPSGDSMKIIGQLVDFAKSARREGLLAQEERLDEVQDKFLTEGLRLVVDGLPPETVENILNNEIEAMQYRHTQGRNVIVHCAKCAPAFGMIGTLIGLVLMLTNLNAETVGTGMAVAVLTTLYGLVASNMIFMPIAEKLRQLHEAEVRIKTLIVRGILAIQSGEHPRIMQMKLQTFLPPSERPDEDMIAEEHIQAIQFPIEDEYEEEVEQAA
jgi:chemotaxis protein MotA